ncbi:helix-turn-helix transcriptional regulator [Agrococcus citreus]
MDRAQLADFVRSRRLAMQPEDVGLARGPRRRTAGLRREELAALCLMSVDYLTRIEQGRSTQPSTQMLAAIARGLRLDRAERDHLLRLAGLEPQRTVLDEHVAPGLMRVLDRLADTPVQVLSAIGEVLVQTAPAAALFGDVTARTGLDRSVVHRWFTDPASRAVYPERDHGLRGRAFIAELRQAAADPVTAERAQRIVAALRSSSEEFRGIWAAHEVGVAHGPEKVLVHPELGEIEAQCQRLIDADTGQRLLVFTATPGTVSAERLRLLAVVGVQRLG